MRYLLFSLFALLLFACQPAEQAPEAAADQQDARTERPDYVLVIHGGAGAIRKENMTAEMDSAYRAGLREAMKVGEAILKNGGTAMDAIEATLHQLEDNHLFNAGKGAVMTNTGTIELDASFMDGATGNAGAVAGIKTIRHPVSAARMVMERSPHVFLTGRGAEQYAAENGLETVDSSYFYTDRRARQLQRAKDREQQKQSAAPADWEASKYGTVGAAALDKDGNLAAATSTGGMTNKRWGRVGDVPVIGAGTYANNETCAVSCTGHGEYFIRNVVAYDLSAKMAYQGLSLAEAAEEIVMQKLVKQGGSGGLIAVDKDGNVTMPFNSAGMFRGFVKSTGEQKVAIYQE
jgi:beta-aspartyl-peptidase (threonine type)